MATDFDVVVY